MNIWLLGEEYEYEIEDGWRLKNFGWYMTKEVFEAVRRKVGITYETLDWGSTLHTLVVKDKGKEIIVFPFILDKGKVRRSMQRAVFAQDYKWYCDKEHLNYFIAVCEELDIDVLGIDIYTGKIGEKNGVVKAKDLEDYFSKLGKSTRKNLRRAYQRDYPKITWEKMTEATFREWSDLVWNNIIRWSAQDETRLDKHEQYIDSYVRYVEELSKLPISKVTLGRLGSTVVCGYLLVFGKDRVHSVVAGRDSETDLDLGHLMQLRKVEQMQEEGIEVLDLGTLNSFPHKARWATDVLDTGAIGEGFI